MPGSSGREGNSQRQGFDLDQIYRKVARLIVRFRWFVVAFWLIAAVVCSAVMPSLSSEVNDNNSAFLNNSEASVKAANLATPLLGAGATGSVQSITIVAYRNDGKLTSADMASVQREIGLAGKVDRIDSVQLAGISPDGAAAQLRVRANVNGSDINAQTDVVNALEATFGKSGAPPGLRFDLAGQIATNVASQQSSNSSSNKIQGFSFLFVIILLLLVFRSLNAAILTLLPSGFALLISMRVIGLMGQAGVQISSITEVLLIVLMIGAGTDYGLFLVFRVREELRSGKEPHQAVEDALVRVGESVTGSAGTVILALLTLLFATFGLYHDLALPLAAGVLIMLMIGLSLLPALLAITGRKAFWPSNTRASELQDGVWGTVATKLLRRPKTTLAVGVLVFLAFAAGGLGYKAGGFGGDSSAPKGSSAARGNAALKQHFPSSSANPANLVFTYKDSAWENPGSIVATEKSLQQSGAFSDLAGPLNPNGATLTTAQLTDLYHKLGPPQKLPDNPGRVPGFSTAEINSYRASALFVSADGTVMQFEAVLKAGGQGSTSAMQATPHIRAVVTEAAKSSGAEDSGVAGEAAAVYDINNTANNDLVRIVPIAIIAIGLLLALVLRSLVAPLYLIISVGLSFLSALGVATILFIDLGGDGGITFVLPFLMFIFLLALGEDYNILVMTRIREEARVRPLKEAVIEAVARTGSTVTSAGIILGGTFAVFGLFGGSGSGGSELRAIGFGLAAGILMDTFLVRTLLVPATVTLLGRWNWWPSKLASAEYHDALNSPESGGSTAAADLGSDSSKSRL
jgi:putative drug exporter of the RND superfamily